MANNKIIKLLWWNLRPVHGALLQLWGPIIRGPGPFIRWGPKAQAEKGDGLGSAIQVRNSLGTQSRTTQSSACPRSHKEKWQKWYGNNLEKKSKISVPIEKGMLESVTTRESCPYCHSILCTWQSHTLQLLQPPSTTLGMGWWDKYQSWNVDPTRGQRIKNTGQYKKKSK